MQQVRSRKRQKVAEACLQCRDKKTKCDGVRPICDTCHKTGLGAECDWARKSVDISREDQRRELESLQQRIAELEGALKQSKDIPHRSGVSIKKQHNDDVSESSDQDQTDDDQNKSPPTWLQQDNSLQNAVGAMDGETTSTADGGFGSSSVATFVKQVDKLLERGQEPISKTEPLALPEQMPTVNEERTPHQPIARVEMPPKPIADHLLNIYWNRVWDMYPFIDKPAFQRWYSHCYTDPKSQNDPIYQSLFNAILAVCAQLDESMHPKQRAESAQTFYERAESLITLEVLDSPRLVIVQALLNMETYLQTTKLAARCWNVAGLAIRVAQRLGIHDEVTLKKLKKSDRETAKRVWHSCVLVDRIIATTFGRPFMISVEHAAIRPPTIDASVDETCPTKTGLQHFVWSLRMFSVLSRLLIRYYNHPRVMDVKQGSDPESDLASALAIDASLTIISDSVPETLKIYENNPYDHIGDEDYHKAVVLRLRFLHIRMLLFRPIILQLCVQQNTNQADVKDHFLESAVFIKCSLTCVRIAQDLVALVEKNLPNGIRESAIPAWWYILFYTYTSGIIFTAAQLCPALSEDITQSELQDSVRKCLDIFEVYVDFDVASHYKSSLDSLEKRINVIKSSSSQQDMESIKPDPAVDFLNQNNEPSSIFTGQESEDYIPTAMSDIGWLVGNPAMPSGFTFDDFTF